MNANKVHRHHHTHQLALGVATLAVVGAVTPATQAHASYTETGADGTIYTIGKASELNKQDSNIIDQSTPGNPNKAKLTCVDHVTHKILQVVLVDYRYYGTIGDEKHYEFTVPTIEGYNSYCTGNLTTNTPGNTLNITVDYNPIITENNMKYSWVEENGIWYYRSGFGASAYRWNEINGKWYYFDETTGAMQTGWAKISCGSKTPNGPLEYKWYYFWSNGQMASNTAVDGYTLGSDGAGVQ